MTNSNKNLGADDRADSGASRAHRPRPRLGLWLVGARGAISTCVAYGVAGLRSGFLPPVGLPSAFPPVGDLDLAAFDDIVLGGHDVCTRDVSQSAGELVAAGVLPADLVAAVAGDASRYEAALRPGILDAPDSGLADLDRRAADRGSLSPRLQIEALQADLDEFQAEHNLERVVVVFVASVEAAVRPRESWESLEAFERALDRGEAQPSSLIYAYAALAAGRAFVNFTPSVGASIPALIQLAKRTGAPIAGNDGKTGETLVKTVLAPMFRARALRVLAWQGYNMLGNRDGEILREPAHRESKLKTKDEALRSILAGTNDDLHTKVAIDYVPSLGDWKTAWDFIHFEGFLGAKMSMQFTWSGCDSALAAPLVIDLARLIDHAQRSDRAGVQEHLACYFKSPLGTETHDFHRQYQLLEGYVSRFK